MPAGSPYRVVVVGAGFGGIGMGIALRRAGIEDFLIVDKGDGPGGTWRDNTYPGAACDVPAHLYSFSFRPGRWSGRFPPQREILAYLCDLAGENGLGPHLRLGTGVTTCRFDEGQAVWDLTLSDGGTIQASAVVSAVGQLNRPALPDIAGRADFTGPSWHSARWDHGADLAGKRVAVVGTGASAIQFVPEVAKTAAHVDVYQRTPPYVLPKTDRRYGETERAFYDRFPVARKADRLRVFLYGELLTSGFVLSPKLLAGPMQLWRRQLSSQISDPGLRAKCVPDYVMGCKRVLFSNDWYPALARPNVDLVTDPIDRIAVSGVVTRDGTTRQADAIIYGTGFKTLDFLAPMEVTGLRGRRLDQTWHEGAEAYLGISVAGFPNFFMLYGPNTNLGGNSILYMLEGQIRYVAAALQALESEGLGWIDVRPEVQRAFSTWVTASSRTSVWESGCHSWYTTASGRNTNNWPDHTFLYRHRVRRFDLGRYRAMPKPGPGPGRARRGPRMTPPPRRPGWNGTSRVRGLRLPPALMRQGVRQIGRRVLDPALAWEVQRRRFDHVMHTSLMPRGTRVAASMLDGVPAEVVTAATARPGRTVVHFHGGGYCLGSARMMRTWAARLSAQAGCRVVVPEYRLAPAHAYPAALDDAHAVLNALLSEADPASIVVSGDSAGGGLALSLILALRDSGAKVPAGGILMSPWLDLTIDRWARPALVRKDLLLNPPWLEACAAAYADPAQWPDPEVSPLRASHGGLPPLLIQAASDDLLAPDAELLATSASTASVDVTYTRWPHMWHDFGLLPGLVSAADSALTQSAWFVTAVTSG